MKIPRACRRSGAVAVVIVLGASACAGGSGQKVTPASGAATITDPIATSVDTTLGPWATAAMGDLTDPLNTFWQLFHRPAGTPTWTDDVEATATATNGGLVLAAQGPEVEVGILTSQDLSFSPVIASTDGGRSWQNGVLPAGLLARPGALALSSGGETIAAVAPGSSTDVVVAARGLGPWRPVTDQGALTSTPAGRACDVTAVEAVGWMGDVPLVGTACSRPGVVGLFGPGSGGTWKGVGPQLPAGLSADTASVLQAHSVTGGGVVALLGLAGSGSYRLLAAWYVPGRGWILSAPLRLPSADALTSAGSSGEAGLFTLIAGGPGRPAELYTLGGPGAGWALSPTPPSGTATVVGPAQGQPEQALSGAKTVLSVSSLAPGWTPSQRLPVQISFGSSN